MQERANALELRLSCINLSTCNVTMISVGHRSGYKFAHDNPYLTLHGEVQCSIGSIWRKYYCVIKRFNCISSLYVDHRALFWYKDCLISYGYSHFKDLYNGNPYSCKTSTVSRPMCVESVGVWNRLGKMTRCNMAFIEPIHHNKPSITSTYKYL